MSRTTTIEWADSTINSSSGCEGCELWRPPSNRHCYAGNIHESRLAKSLPDLYDADFQNVRLIPGRMKKAASWPDLRGKERKNKPWLNGYPRTIFVGDMGDFCSKSVPDDYIKTEIIDPIDSPAGRRHFWLLLTKQIQRLAKLSHKIGGLPDNCMAMTTITNQRYANLRLPWLMNVACEWRGVSAEPLLGLIDLKSMQYASGSLLPAEMCVNNEPCSLNALEGITTWPTCHYQSPTIKRNSILKEGIYYESSGEHRRLDWVIVGGESGPNARPMEDKWARSLMQQCKAAGVPFFMKQGSVANWPDFKNFELFPEDLRVREFPC